MGCSQERIRDRLEAFHRDTGKDGFAVSIKVRVSPCFCREHHAPVANRLIDDYRTAHPLDPSHCEYIEHESGPELVVYVTLGIVVLSLVKSAIELATTIIKARFEGRKQGDSQHGPVVIVVRGFGLEGAFYEKEVLQANLETPPTEKAIEESLAGVIQLIAEERTRQQQ